MNSSPCPRCGSLTYRADRSLAGRLICSQCGAPYGSINSYKGNIVAGRKYSSKLITLPAFLVDNNYSNDMDEICKGLILTGYFMKKFLYKDLGKDLPLNRTRLLEKIQTIK